MCVAEASYTLLLYDELLEWSDRPLREFLNYPMQSEWQRKEYLHLTIIQNFDRGKVSRRRRGKSIRNRRGGKPSNITRAHIRTSVPAGAPRPS